MKRAKIMLLTIAVIATVGSALAFKVNKMNATGYCYLETNTQPPTGGCTAVITDVNASSSGSKLYYYVEKGTSSCSSLVCDKTAKSFIDE